MSIVPHRVGGSGCEVHYLERIWVDNRLMQETIWEVNYCFFGTGIHKKIHPYEGLQAVVDLDPEDYKVIEKYVKQYNESHTDSVMDIHGLRLSYKEWNLSGELVIFKQDVDAEYDLEFPED
eukprot:TRINITY_DN44126_c0_g1_i1.p1 TRINITY_DN44126_c0_g1~~TRINITY_DN44126_c0_g1_i1.p1  ORF type:complete len:121 (-),score=10.74 TRINITY_DN44126_c0_g1_i1:45-407(-)